MANKNDKNNIKDERIEDVTRYGEFISSFHQWMTLDRQRQVSRHLEDVTEVSTEASKELMTGDAHIKDQKNMKDKKRSN